jgi:hypothetical protein
VSAPAEANAAEPTATRARRWSEAALLLLGAIGLVVLVYPTFVLIEALPKVDPSQLGHGVTYSGSDIDRRWIAQALLSALLLMLVTGLPIGRLAGRGSLPGAVAQLIGGLAVVFWTLAGTALSSMYFWGPDDRCTYASCWPLHQQIAAILAPGVLTAIVMIVMALLINRLAWWIRTLVPAVVWVAVLVVQHVVWVNYLLPLFQASPT